MPVKPSVDYFHTCKRFPFPRNRLDALALRIYKEEKLEKQQRISVIFCSNSFIKKLNRLFRKKNSPTDVLSFNYNDKSLLGEIYISLEQANRQALEYNHTLADEISRLFVHGMFHLLGYDHETAPDRRKMESKESNYCLLD